jgi:hypothetical protein
MKTTFIRVAKASIVVLSIASCGTTQRSIDNGSSSISEKIDSQRFTFVAESVTPMRGGTRFLSSPYDVYVSKDSVVAFLPYFGRSTSAPADLSEGGIKFTSTRFSYKADNRPDRWDIMIKPGDTRDAQQFLFTIFRNGKANLQVTSNSRDMITFAGRIK